MKKNKWILYALAAFVLLLNSGCEDFLDKSPEMGADETAIYKDYNTITGYIDYAFWNYLVNYHAINDHGNGHTYFGAVSDEFATMWNGGESVKFHTGNWLQKERDNTFEIGSLPAANSNTEGPPICRSYRAIRLANRVINNADRIQNCTPEQLNCVLGQAYFYRAWFYFQLIIRYGGMPILDQVYVGSGEEDIPRKTYHESHDWMMTDIEKAIEMLPEYWDQNNTGRPNKVAAMAFKEMALLYDASPLMQNDLTSTVVKGYDKDRAAKAAVAADEVLKYLKEFPRDGGTPPYYYRMYKASEYKNIFYFSRGAGAPYICPEHLWYCRKVASGMALLIRYFWLFFTTDNGTTGPDAASGFMPSQNMVDMYEKKGPDGNYYPITDPRAGYDPQDPYADRDPRFKNNIITPGEAWGQKTGKTFYWTTYVSNDAKSEYNIQKTNPNSNQRNASGYVCRKYLWPECNDFTAGGYALNNIMTCYIRYAQVYLDYAEASFESTGSATAKVPGCSMTAEEALNFVRNRVGVTNVASDIVNDPVQFRETLRRERTVELMFENHRWFDMRRWMIMHELFAKPNPIKGMAATPITPLVPPPHPNALGFFADDPRYDSKNPQYDPDYKKQYDSLLATFNAYDITIDPGNADLKFKYEVIDLPAEVRGYTMKNYWYPFTIVEVASQKNLVQNPYW